MGKTLPGIMGQPDRRVDPISQLTKDLISVIIKKVANADRVIASWTIPGQAFFSENTGLN